MGCKQCKIFSLNKPQNSIICQKHQSISSNVTLDCLPVELIYHIFDRLDTYTIFTSLYNVSKRLNSIILTYDQYHLNCQSITQNYFHRICSFIRPEQIISLTLSDGYDTVGLVDRFLQKYDSFESFERLKSLTLRNIDNNEQIMKICLSLPSQLKYLSIENADEMYDDTVIDIILANLRKTNLIQFQLDLERNRILNSSILWPNECYLHEINLIGLCNLSLFRQILIYSPNLRKFQTYDIDFDDEWIDSDDEEDDEENQMLPIINASNLITLSLIYARTELDKLEWFLPQFTQLKSFQYLNIYEFYSDLFCENENNLINGEHWQRFLYHCENFQLILTINYDEQTWNIHEYLLTYQTKFWKEKNWNIAFEQSETILLIYSIPYPHQSYCYNQPISFSLSTNPILTMNNVTKLRIYINAIQNLHLSQRTDSPRFFHVNQLILDGQWRTNDFLESLSSLISLTNITKLVRLERVPTIIFHAFLNRLIYLKSLTLTTFVLDSLNAANFHYSNCLYSLDIIQLDDDHHHQQQQQQHSYVNIEPFCSMFSRIQHLDLPIDNLDSCQYIIERFEKDLISLIFRFSNIENEDDDDDDDDDDDSKYQESVQWIENLHRNYLYRIRDGDIYLWLR